MSRATKGSAGLDIVAQETVDIGGGGSARISVTPRRDQYLTLLLGTGEEDTLGLLVNKSSSVTKNFVVEPQVCSSETKWCFVPLEPDSANTIEDGTSSSVGTVLVRNISDTRSVTIHKGQAFCQVLAVKREKRKNEETLPIVVVDREIVTWERGDDTVAKKLSSHLDVATNEEKQSSIMRFNEEYCFVVAPKYDGRQATLRDALVSWKPTASQKYNSNIKRQASFMPGIIDSDYRGICHCIVHGDYDPSKYEFAGHLLSLRQGASTGYIPVDGTDEEVSTISQLPLLDDVIFEYVWRECSISESEENNDRGTKGFGEATEAAAVASAAAVTTEEKVPEEKHTNQRISTNTDVE